MRRLTPEAKRKMLAGTYASHGVPHKRDPKKMSAAGKKGGRIGGVRVHQLHPFHGHENGIKGTHTRFHVNRGISKPLTCPLCAIELGRNKR
jgi:hypothetical protein